MTTPIEAFLLDLGLMLDQHGARVVDQTVLIPEQCAELVITKGEDSLILQITASAMGDIDIFHVDQQDDGGQTRDRHLVSHAKHLTFLFL